MKRTLKSMAMVMAIAIATTGLGINTNALEVKAASNVTYTLSKGVLTIKGKGKMPNSMTFKNNVKIKKIVIKEGITSISKKAFEGCKKLREVKIPNSMITIGRRSFANTGIKKIKIPYSVETIGVNVFDGCKRLRSITMPGDVKILQSGYAHYTLNPGTDVETIKFTTNLNLENITYLYADKFDVYKNDDKYKDIEGVIYTKDGKELVRVPSGCKELVVDQGCEVFCTNAIYYSYWGEDCVPHGLCGELRKVVLPENVKEIDDKKHFEIRSGAPYEVYIEEWEIQNKKIVGIQNLVEAEYDGDSELIDIYKRFKDLVTIKDDMCIVDDSILVGYVGNQSNVVIPEGIKEIQGDVFGFNSINSLTLPNSLEVIGKNALRDLSVNQIKVPDSVKVIGNNAFEGCKYLYSVELPEGLETIGEEAFKGCLLIEKMEIPKSVKTIGNRAFYESGIKEIVLPETLQSLGEGALGYSALEKITIPSGLKKLENNVFECTELTSVTIPDTIEEIGEKVFYDCTSLSEIIIGKNVKKIGKEAFAETGLTKVTVPENVERIEKGAFSYCKNAEEIVIDNENISVDKNAFTNSNKLVVVSDISPNKITTGIWIKKYREKKNSTHITYAWNKISGVVGYKIEIAANKRFTKKVTKKFVQGNTYKVKIKYNNTKYIRVMPVFEINGIRVFGQWSSVING